MFNLQVYVHVKVTDSPNKTGTVTATHNKIIVTMEIYVLTVTIIKACLELFIDSF